MTKILLIGMTLVVGLVVLAMANALVRLMLNFMVSLIVSLGLSVPAGIFVALSLGVGDVQNSALFGALAAMVAFILILLAMHWFRHGSRAARLSSSNSLQEVAEPMPATIPPVGETPEMSYDWDHVIEMAPKDLAALDRARHVCAAVLMQAKGGLLDIEIIDMVASLRNHLASLITETQEAVETIAEPSDENKKALKVSRLIALGKRCQSLLDPVQNCTGHSLDILHHRFSAFLGDDAGLEDFSPSREKT